MKKTKNQRNFHCVACSERGGHMVPRTRAHSDSRACVGRNAKRRCHRPRPGCPRSSSNLIVSVDNLNNVDGRSNAGVANCMGVLLGCWMSLVLQRLVRHLLHRLWVCGWCSADDMYRYCRVVWKYGFDRALNELFALMALLPVLYTAIWRFWCHGLNISSKRLLR